MCACTCLFKHECHSDLSLGVFYSTCLCTHTHTSLSTFLCSMSFILVMWQPCFDWRRSLSFYFYVQYLMVPFLNAVRQEIVVSVSLPNVFFFVWTKRKIRYSSEQRFVFPGCDEKQLVARIFGLLRDQKISSSSSSCELPHYSTTVVVK